MKVINRIKKSDDFALTIKKGHSLNSDIYTIHYINNELNHIRIGLSVSAKLGNAVTRNLIKRQCRAMCQDLSFDQYAKDIVIVVRKPYLNQDYKKNKESLFNLLIKILEK